MPEATKFNIGIEAKTVIAAALVAQEGARDTFWRIESSSQCDDPCARGCECALVALDLLGLPLRCTKSQKVRSPSGELVNFGVASHSCCRYMAETLYVEIPILHLCSWVQGAARIC